MSINPPESPSSAWADDTGRSPTDASEQSLNDLGPPTPTHGNGLSPVSKSADTEVFYPYAIEEPEEESNTPLPRPDLPPLPDYLERWQRDLIEHIHDFDTSDREYLSTGETRGQKRKSANFTNRCASASYRSRPSLTVTGLSSKRRRRRMRQSGDSANSDRLESLHQFRESQKNGSSSSDLQSSDTSSPDAESLFPTDTMDID